MPKGSDTAYLTNLHGDFEGHNSYVKGTDRRHWESEFGIRHYAGCVSYTVKGFVDKNRDVQQDVLFDFMSRSRNCFVQELASYQVRFNFLNSRKIRESFLSLFIVGSVINSTTEPGE